MSVAADLQAAGEGELLALAAHRRPAAFAEIVRRHYRPVHRLVWRLMGGHGDAEDAVQEAFVKLWHNPRQVRDANALRAWLMRVAANGAIDRGRRMRHEALDAGSEAADPALSAERRIDRHAAARAVEREIAALPGRQRLALSLVHFEGLSNIAAAAVMETSVEAVESLLARARRSLRDSFAGEWREVLESLSDDGS